MTSLIFFIFLATIIYIGFKLPNAIKTKKQIQSKLKSKIKADSLKKKVSNVKKNISL